MTVQPLHLRMYQAADRATERVARERSDIDPKRVLIVLAVALPIAFGWIMGSVVRIIWAIASWAWAGIVVGYRSGRHVEGGGG